MGFTEGLADSRNQLGETSLKEEHIMRVGYISVIYLLVSMMCHVQASFVFWHKNPDTKVHHILVQFGTQNYSKSIGHEEEAAYFTFSLRYEVCQCADVHLHHASLYRCRSSPRHLYILSRGLVALNHRVGFDGAVPWR